MVSQEALREIRPVVFPWFRVIGCGGVVSTSAACLWSEAELEILLISLLHRG